MIVRFAEAQDARLWDEFVYSSKGSFLQLWSWGEFQSVLGFSCWRILIEGDNSQIVAVAQVIERKVAPLTTYLYVPRGPIWNNNRDAFLLLQSRLADLAKERGSIFVRIDPLISSEEFSFSDWHNSISQIQPQHTLVLDLQKSSDELLSRMHSKHRYNIRLAERKGVQVRFSTEVRDVESFLKLAREVEGKGKFSYHSDSYYQNMVKVLSRDGVIELSVAEYKGESLAVHIILYSGKIAAYVHGASSAKQRELMASHLLFWREIERAREKGCEQFDFYGIAPAEASSTHSWAGITRMKKGFGGREVSYMSAQDFILKKISYKIFTLGRKILHIF